MKSVLKPVQKTSEKFVHFNPWRVTEPLMVKQLLLACIYYKNIPSIKRNFSVQKLYLQP